MSGRHILKWQRLEIQQIADIIDCKHRTPKYSVSGVPIVSPGNISWGPLVLEGCKTITYEEYLSLMDHCRVRVGDLVMGRNQTFGIVAYVAGEEPFALGQDTVLIQAGSCLSSYLYFYLQSDQIKLQISRLSSGSTFKRINLQEIRRLHIDLPPLAEQRKIATILGTWDAAIAAVERLVAALRERKRGLMQRLLTGQVRFPGFERSSWATTKLGNIATVKRGASPRPIHDTKYFSEEGRGWVRIVDVTEEPTRYLKATSQYLSSLGESKSVRVEPGELIMSICATIGVPKIVQIPACIHDGFVLLKDYEQKLQRDFLYHYISFITDQLAHSGQPGTQKNLNTSIVQKMSVPLISLPEQSVIVAILNACEDELLLLEKQRSALTRQKRGLMQQLLTGQVRVAVADDSMPASGTLGPVAG